jgi:DNA-binding MarR family transcriptional regulator
LSALSVVERRGPLRLGDLALRERITKSSVTRLVAKLEEKGYVALSADPIDGRSSIAAITSKGEDLLENSRVRVDAYLTTALGQLSDAEVAQIYEAIPALESLLENHR